MKKKNWYKGLTATAIMLAMAGTATVIPAFAEEQTEDPTGGSIQQLNEQDKVWTVTETDGPNTSESTTTTNEDGSVTETQTTTTTVTSTSETKTTDEETGTTIQEDLTKEETTTTTTETTTETGEPVETDRVTNPDGSTTVTTETETTTTTETTTKTETTVEGTITETKPVDRTEQTTLNDADWDYIYAEIKGGRGYTNGDYTYKLNEDGNIEVTYSSSGTSTLTPEKTAELMGISYDSESGKYYVMDGETVVEVKVTDNSTSTTTGTITVNVSNETGEVENQEVEESITVYDREVFAESPEKDILDKLINNDTSITKSRGYSDQTGGRITVDGVDYEVKVITLLVDNLTPDEIEKLTGLTWDETKQEYTTSDGKTVTDEELNLEIEKKTRRYSVQLVESESETKKVDSDVVNGLDTDPTVEILGNKSVSEIYQAYSAGEKDDDGYFYYNLDGVDYKVKGSTNLVEKKVGDLTSDQLSALGFTRVDDTTIIDAAGNVITDSMVSYTTYTIDIDGKTWTVTDAVDLSGTVTDYDTSTVTGGYTTGVLNEIKDAINSGSYTGDDGKADLLKTVKEKLNAINDDIEWTCSADSSGMSYTFTGKYTVDGELTLDEMKDKLGLSDSATYDSTTNTFTDGNTTYQVTTNELNGEVSIITVVTLKSNTSFVDSAVGEGSDGYDGWNYNHLDIKINGNYVDSNNNESAIVITKFVVTDKDGNNVHGDLRSENGEQEYNISRQITVDTQFTVDLEYYFANDGTKQTNTAQDITFTVGSFQNICRDRDNQRNPGYDIRIRITSAPGEVTYSVDTIGGVTASSDVDYYLEADKTTINTAPLDIDVTRYDYTDIDYTYLKEVLGDAFGAIATDYTGTYSYNWTDYNSFVPVSYNEVVETVTNVVLNAISEVVESSSETVTEEDTYVIPAEEGPVIIPEDPNPIVINIDPEEPPLVENPEVEPPEEEIDDEEIPLTPTVPEEQVDDIIAEIEDEVTPLTSVPATGVPETAADNGFNGGAAAAAGFAAIAAAINLLRKLKRSR